MNYKDAHAKTILITGASSGIGYEIARQFARRKHALILVARESQKLNQAAGSLEREFQIKPAVISLDLSEAGSARKLYNEVLKLGRPVDILINNAGYGIYGEFLKTDAGSEKAMIQLNITTLTELTRFFLPGMIERKWGRILNVASTAAFQPGPLMSVYYATKAYVLNFSEGIREELSGSGVKVSVLCPGPTISEFQKRAAIAKIVLLDIGMMGAERVAKKAYQGVMSGKAVIIPGTKNKLFSFGVRLSPRFLVRKIVHWLQK